MARFLERLSEPGPWTRSRLQRGVALNYDVFRRYLEFLLERGHVALAPGDRESFMLTPNGTRLRSELLEWVTHLFGSGGWP